MLETILTHINNWFVREKISGRFEISSGAISNEAWDVALQPGQYFRIMGSVFNDGLHKFGGADTLQDETFVGEIWALAIPKAVVDLSTEISTWCEKNPASDKTSESFGGYSYTRGTAKGSGQPLSWTDIYRAKLNAWRKL